MCVSDVVYVVVGLPVVLVVGTCVAPVSYLPLLLCSRSFPRPCCSCVCPCSRPRPSRCSRCSNRRCWPLMLLSSVILVDVLSSPHAAIIICSDIVYVFPLSDQLSAFASLMKHSEQLCRTHVQAHDVQDFIASCRPGANIDAVQSVSMSVLTVYCRYRSNL